MPLGIWKEQKVVRNSSHMKWWFAGWEALKLRHQSLGASWSWWATKRTFSYGSHSIRASFSSMILSQKSASRGSLEPQKMGGLVRKNSPNLFTWGSALGPWLSALPIWLTRCAISLVCRARMSARVGWTGGSGRGISLLWLLLPPEPLALSLSVPERNTILSVNKTVNGQE